MVMIPRDKDSCMLAFTNIVAPRHQLCAAYFTLEEIMYGEKLLIGTTLLFLVLHATYLKF